MTTTVETVNLQTQLMGEQPHIRFNHLCGATSITFHENKVEARRLANHILRLVEAAP